MQLALLGVALKLYHIMHHENYENYDRQHQHSHRADNGIIIHAMPLIVYGVYAPHIITSIILVIRNHGHHHHHQRSHDQLTSTITSRVSTMCALLLCHTSSTYST
eukprot:9343796-Pyramimonas_sp.AAC.1